MTTTSGTITLVGGTPRPSLQAEFASGDALELSANAPNPFASSTRIRFVLPAQQEVRLAVYNLLGQEVGVLAEGTLDAARTTWPSRPATSPRAYTSTGSSRNPASSAAGWSWRGGCPRFTKAFP